jgi:UDP-4-amino-4,6-dideoxy-N-acetyl-beta-L-altrosamine N-acetyltransferase
MPLHLRNFTTLTHAESDMVLRWRNTEKVRTFMYNPTLISEEEHASFLSSLRERDDKRYFLLLRNAEPIGVVDMTQIGQDSAMIGLYANPECDEKGIGSLLMQSLISYGFEQLRLKTLYAEVFEYNARAKALYEKCGFYEINRKQVNEKKVICMELRA